RAQPGAAPANRCSSVLRPSRRSQLPDTTAAWTCLHVIPALVAGTRDGISFVRSLAAWHLGRLGPRHSGIEVAVPYLRELLNDNDPSVGAEALVALENLGGKGAPPAELRSL